MRYPKSVVKIIVRCRNKYGTDIDQGVRKAVAAIKALPEFDELADQFLTTAVRKLLDDSRHQANEERRRNEGAYDIAAKVIPGTSKIVGDTLRASSLYSHYIGSTMLGHVYGRDLKGIASSESARASGHEFNATLCLKLSRIVPANKQVRQAVSEKKLRALFYSIQRDAG